jgi:hypothetical protein
MMKSNGSVWILLAVGVLFRLVALGDPVVDAMHLRQAQTADAIASMAREGGFPLDSEASWRGDLGARVVQEFPIYNHAALVLMAAGIPLTIAAKLISVAFWVLAFLVLQRVWDRLLVREERFWANLLFVLSPLSVFFGQAVMPEALVVFLTCAFVAFWLKHFDTGHTLPLLAASAVALAGLLVKLPAFSYLGAFAAFTLGFSGQWKRFLDWRYYMVAVVLILAIKFWGTYADAISSVHFSRWSASENIGRFIGPLSERFSPLFWFRIFAYNFTMVATPFVFVLCLGAFFGKSDARAPHDRAKLLGAWWLSLLVFILGFGPHTASNHSYYNLPMLMPFAALFGIAAVKTASWAGTRWPKHGRVLARGLFAVALLGTLPATLHLFTKDTHTLAVATWIRENTAPDEMTVVRWVGNPTPDIPTVSFYAERRLWIWSPYTPESEKMRALATSSHAVLTKPVDRRSPIVRAWHRLRGFNDPSPRVGFPPDGSGFEPLHETDEFVVFHKPPGQSPGWRPPE